MPALHLALQLDRTNLSDTFGSLEWVLANARRTGLTLQQMSFDASRANVARLVCQADTVELLELFVRRVVHGVDLEVLDAAFTGEQASVAEPEALAA
ncbi:AsnC family transcriptional regulator [Cupriavidus pauculus]|uniref:AsnC family transcriptional regulator n=1 Tax=Cupriavidus pauculus TaxID=82633 RepID=A0A2N5C4M5_9BURK|nr:AsnC family transcriptional regulator [Cupriavidus pauculus]PLP97167.1 AsnC family transcriptional regulator [Cupriavidus pauculus]